MGDFVVQQHQKSPWDLHFDLMLARGEVLKTWSFVTLPFGDSGPYQGDKIFDHRLKYLAFEGDIGRGLGWVKIWDRGTYRVVYWEDERIEIFLEGRKIYGTYQLSLLKKNSWILQKKNETPSPPQR